MARPSPKTINWSKLAPNAWKRQNWQEEQRSKSLSFKRIERRTTNYKLTNPLNFIQKWLEQHWTRSYHEDSLY